MRSAPSGRPLKSPNKSSKSCCGAVASRRSSVWRRRSSISTLGLTFSWMYSGGALTTRSDQSC
ncbi:Uncharacterised protein [Bordetella pertussis]|nr:Uncharacterised protein [Bordetella pertussis]